MLVEAPLGRAEFLARLLWRLVEREIERLPADQTERLIELTSDIAGDMLSLYHEAVDPTGTSAAEVELRFLARICSEQIEDITAIDWLLGELEP